MRAHPLPLQLGLKSQSLRLGEKLSMDRFTSLTLWACPHGCSAGSQVRGGPPAPLHRPGHQPTTTGFHLLGQAIGWWWEVGRQVGSLLFWLSAFCVGRKCLSQAVILLGEGDLLFRGFSQRQQVTMTCLMSPFVEAANVWVFSGLWKWLLRFGCPPSTPPPAPGSWGSWGKLLRAPPSYTLGL